MILSLLSLSSSFWTTAYFPPSINAVVHTHRLHSLESVLERAPEQNFSTYKFHSVDQST